MGQTVTAAVTVPRSAYSSLRFLGLLEQPTDSDQNPDNTNPNPSLACSPELDDRGGGGRPRPSAPEPRGLSAALGDDSGGGGGAPVRRLAAAQAARPVPVPVAVEGVLRLRQSAPVVVPAWPKRTRVRRERLGECGEEEEEERGEGEEDEDAEEEEEEGMVPPHVMVGRAHVMTFSVMEGAGRTLKGRDLRRVRNAVLERTGFLA